MTTHIMIITPEGCDWYEQAYECPKDGSCQVYTERMEPGCLCLDACTPCDPCKDDEHWGCGQEWNDGVSCLGCPPCQLDAADGCGVNNMDDVGFTHRLDDLVMSLCRQVEWDEDGDPIGPVPMFRIPVDTEWDDDTLTLGIAWEVAT
jgi:hypothetical protein